MGDPHEFSAGDPALRNGPSVLLHTEVRGGLACAVATGGDALAIEAPGGTVTWVAALSAGCGDVPLDLSHPADRLAAMLNDAQPSHI
jgi:non-ribosomal peptide synthetase component F